MSGFAGFTSTSDAPTLSDRKRTFFQVLPPSFVLKMPRSGFFLNALPTAATQATSGFVGWMRTAPIWPTSYKPTNDHVWPPSVDLYTPRPVDTLLRRPSDPVPT